MQLLPHTDKSSIIRGKMTEHPMSQVDDIKANAAEIRQGLKKLGPDRVVALSVHKQKELIVELEEKADQLLQQLESIG